MQSVGLLRTVAAALSAAAILVGCGGGGGGGAAEPIRPANITVTAQDTSLLNNPGNLLLGPETEFATTIVANVQTSNGNAVTDGSIVTFTINNANLGILADPDSAPGDEGNDFTVTGTQLQIPTAGGQAQVIYITGDGTGDATITATFDDAFANRTVSDSVTVNVQDNDGQAPQRVQLSAGRTVLPANVAGVPIFFGSPFIATVTLQYFDAQGTLTTPAEGEFGVGIGPVDIAAFSTPDDPETEEIDEFFVLLANGPVDAAGGTSTVFVHSFDSPGNVTLFATAIDPTTGEEFDGSLTFEIREDASTATPRSVVVSPAGNAQYTQGSGGTTSRQLLIEVLDAGNEPVPDPSTVSPPFNNVLLELVQSTTQGGEELTSTNVAGEQVVGDEIAIATTNGIATASVRSGDSPGIVSLQVTADAADNNVDNGVQIPETAVVPLVISDGVPFGIEITTFPLGTISVNPADPLVGPGVTVDPETGLPPAPDGTYSLIVSAIVTDRFGNPPAQSVQVQFGLLTDPVSGYPFEGSGTFQISGGDGDPEENGLGFIAPTGQFLTAGGGVGPGDTLLTLGELVTGASDLEQAQIVGSIQSETELSVLAPFNPNDVTGESVDLGSVIPYIIGRGSVGNVDSPAQTDATGTASTLINYPVSQLGRVAALFAQTSGSALADGRARSVADISILAFPGVAPAVLTASPSQIPANRTALVTLCLEDAFTVPIQGAFIGFASQASGIVTVDGQTGSGVVANATGPDGCTIATVESSGFTSDAATDDQFINFFNGDASAQVELVVADGAILQANPTSFRGDGTFTITLTYIDASGGPIPNIAIAGQCEASNGTISLIEGPGVTGADGTTTARVSVMLNAFNEPGEGTCEFTAGDASVTVDFVGFDLCDQFVQPSPSVPPECDLGGGQTVTLNVQYTELNPGGQSGSANISASGASISCDYNFATQTQSGTCSDNEVQAGSSVTLQLNGGTSFSTWSGDCAFAGNATSVTITADVNRSCTAIFD